RNYFRLGRANCQLFSWHFFHCQDTIWELLWVRNREKMAKRVDNTWGAPGTALLPDSLRNLWGGEPLPAWVASELRLPAGATILELDETIWERSGLTDLADRHRNFILNLA